MDISVEQEIVWLYRAGCSFMRIGSMLGINRKVVRDILVSQGEPLRIREPWSKARHNAYEKTPKGFLMRAYRNMQSRVEGIQKKSAKHYIGLPLLKREEFYNWSFTNSDFWNLYNAWESSGFPKKLAPSVDRINAQLGYELSNMQWITHSENSGKLQFPSTNRFGQGEKHFKATISDELAKQIKSDSAPPKILYKKYAVSYQIAYNISKGTTWKHLGAE